MNVVSLAQNILLYKLNAFSILTNHLSFTVAEILVAWGVTTSATNNNFISLLHNFTENLFLPYILAISTYRLFFLIKSTTFNFSFKGSTLQLLFGIFELPASQLLQFGAITKENKGHLNTSTAMPIYVLHGLELNSVRFHHTTQNGVQFKSYELFISGIFHLIFLDSSWPQITETMKSETVNKGGLLYWKTFWSFPVLDITN